jgi:hypothetical protein
MHIPSPMPQRRAWADKLHQLEARIRRRY